MAPSPPRPARFRQRWLGLFAAALLAGPAPAATARTPATTVMQTWQAAQDRAQAAYAAGDLATAEQSARDALGQARAGQGGSQAFVASSLNLLALVRQRQGQPADAVRLLREALATSAENPEAHDTSAALALNLGQALETSAQPDEAIDAYRRSLEMAADGPVRSQALAALSRLLADRGRHAEAGIYNQQLLDRAGTLPPAEQVPALWRQARLQESQAQADAAVASLQKALAVTVESALPQVEILSALAALHGRLGHYDEAAPLHRRAVALLEPAGPHAAMALAGQLNELSLWHLQRREFDEARALLQRALVLVQAQSPQGLEAARILANLAQLEEARADAAQADTLFRQALAIYERHGDLPEALLGQAQALNFLAGQDYRRRRLKQAEPQFLRALALTEQAAGPQSPRLLPLLDNLVALYRGQRREDLAAPFAQRAAAFREAGIGT